MGKSQGEMELKETILSVNKSVRYTDDESLKKREK